MKTEPQVIRTKNFVADAAGFILEQAHKALGERNEFRIALSGGNTPRPVYARIAAVGTGRSSATRRARAGPSAVPAPTGRSRSRPRA